MQILGKGGSADEKSILCSINVSLSLTGRIVFMSRTSLTSGVKLGSALETVKLSK